MAVKAEHARALPRGGYPALDGFRLVAALLVVAVHTSPLWSVNETADFLFARVLARVAVPFFFLASGFFFTRHHNTLPRFLGKIARLYGVCILLYLPLNLYRGDFSRPHLAAEMAKDLVWNGTVYHLWYFPAVLLGGCIAWACRRWLPAWAGLALCGVLYLVGVGGDSWYGVVSGLPWAKAAYGGMFTLFDYTRNGLFFAPLFLYLGMLLGGREKPTDKPLPNLAGLFACLTAMAAEALALRASTTLRHDSMYLALPLCSWFLFRLLLAKTGRGRPGLRGLSTLVFVLHPWCIVGVRGVAKVLKAEPLLVQTSPVFYLLVCLASLALALVVMRLPKPPFRRRKEPGPHPADRVWAETDAGALAHNLQQLQRLMAPGCEMMAVLKDDAYGHGAVWVARQLRRQGVRAFAVATMEEGIALRRHGVGGTILVLGYTSPAAAGRLWFYRLTQTAVDLDHAKALSRIGWPVQVHLKVDTGMHRLGIPAEDAAAFCDAYALPRIRVKGLFTHLARADSLATEDERFTKGQVEAFYGLVEWLTSLGITVGKIHLQSSYGLLNYPGSFGTAGSGTSSAFSPYGENPGSFGTASSGTSSTFSPYGENSGLPCDYVRCGLALYGLAAGLGVPSRAAVRLRPVLSLKARVASVYTVPAGGWVGYGQGYQCVQDTRVATVTIGYGDGLPRAYEGGELLLRGRRVPILGRICMDQLCVCVDGVPEAAAGDTVTVIGGQTGAEEIAAQAGTIPNEVLARIGRRVRHRPLPEENRARGRAPAKCRAVPAFEQDAQKVLHRAQ